MKKISGKMLKSGRSEIFLQKFAVRHFS